MTMTDDELAPILQACLEQVAAGAIIETCLAAYPDQKDELEPLLRAAVGVVRLPRPTLTAAAHSAIEQRILAQVALRRMAPSNQSNPSTPPAPSPAAPTLFGLPIWIMLIIAVSLGLLLIIALLRTTVVGPTPLPPTPSPIVITTPIPSATATLPSPVPTALLHSSSTAQPVTTAETIVQRRPDPTAVPAPPALDNPAPPVNPPAAPPDSGDDKACQGLQIGRDDKKCEPDKPGKPDKPPDKKGDD